MNPHTSVEVGSATGAAPHWRWGRSAAHDPAERQASALHGAYAPHGGVIGIELFSTLLRAHSDQPISQIARWIVARKLVQFSWHGQTQLPLFQFDMADMSLRPGVRQVIEELQPAFDDIDVADWFVQPNSMLSGALPVQVLALDPAEVQAAARADRFVVLG